MDYCPSVLTAREYETIRAIGTSWKYTSGIVPRPSSATVFVPIVQRRFIPSSSVKVVGIKNYKLRTTASLRSRFLFKDAVIEGGKSAPLEHHGIIFRPITRGSTLSSASPFTKALKLIEITEQYDLDFVAKVLLRKENHSLARFARDRRG